jgi:type II secretory pathway component PulF
LSAAARSFEIVVVGVIVVLLYMPIFDMAGGLQ